MPLTPLILTAAVSGALPPDLAQAAKAFDEAQISQDRPALERLLADGYLLVNGGGRTEDKTRYIADLTDPNVRLSAQAVEEPVQKVWADGAVLGGLTTEAGLDHGVHFHARIRFANVWRKQGGAWRVVYTQVSQAP